VTDTGQIASEGFAFTKDSIYPKAKPTAIPVIEPLRGPAAVRVHDKGADRDPHGDG